MSLSGSTMMASPRRATFKKQDDAMREDSPVDDVYETLPLKMDFGTLPLRSLARYRQVFHIDTPQQSLEEEIDMLNQHFDELDAQVVCPNFEMESIAYFIYSVRNQGMLKSFFKKFIKMKECMAHFEENANGYRSTPQSSSENLSKCHSLKRCSPSTSTLKTKFIVSINENPR